MASRSRLTPRPGRMTRSRRGPSSSAHGPTAPHRRRPGRALAGWDHVVDVTDLVLTQSVAWAVDIDAGSIGPQAAAAVSVMQGGWHGKQPLSVTAGNGSLVTTAGADDEITITAGLAQGADLFTDPSPTPTRARAGPPPLASACWRSRGPSPRGGSMRRSALRSWTTRSAARTAPMSATRRRGARHRLRRRRGPRAQRLARLRADQPCPAGGGRRDDLRLRPGAYPRSGREPPAEGRDSAVTITASGTFAPRLAASRSLAAPTSRSTPARRSSLRREFRRGRDEAQPAGGRWRAPAGPQ